MNRFVETAPWIMRLLMEDFGLTALEAAAICGNLGHETAGFTLMQELRPHVPGSKGGYGWAQWTGPRRRAFEAYCARNRLDPASDRANYGFLFVELNGGEAGAIERLKRVSKRYPGKLREVVIAFERAFERAGIKHDDSRVRFAEAALAAFLADPTPALPEWARPEAGSPEKQREGRLGVLSTMLATLAGALAALAAAFKRRV